MKSELLRALKDHRIDSLPDLSVPRGNFSPRRFKVDGKILFRKKDLQQKKRLATYGGISSGNQFQVEETYREYYERAFTGQDAQVKFIYNEGKDTIEVLLQGKHNPDASIFTWKPHADRPFDRMDSHQLIVAGKLEFTFTTRLYDRSILTRLINKPTKEEKRLPKIEAQTHLVANVGENVLTINPMLNGKKPIVIEYR